MSVSIAGVHRQRSLPPVLVAAALALGCAANARADAPGAARALTFVSINVLHGGVTSGLFGDGHELEARLALLAEELHELAPDVVGVQEASTSRGRGNTAARLASALGFTHVYAPALFRLTGLGPVDALIAALMNFSEGPAILSRYPITASEVRALPRCGGPFDPRVVLHAEIATPSGPVHAYSTHLSWGGCQAAAVAAFVDERRGPVPSVVMGDFNADEDMAAIAYLTGTGGFVDVFRVLEPDAPGFTVWQRPGVAESTVRRRVDFVFLVPGTHRAGRAVASRVVLDRPARTPEGRVLWPSDHFGVLAKIDVAGGGRGGL